MLDPFYALCGGLEEIASPRRITQEIGQHKSARRSHNYKSKKSLQSVSWLFTSKPLFILKKNYIVARGTELLPKLVRTYYLRCARVAKFAGELHQHHDARRNFHSVHGRLENKL